VFSIYGRDRRAQSSLKELHTGAQPSQTAPSLGTASCRHRREPRGPGIALYFDKIFGKDTVRFGRRNSKVQPKDLAQHCASVAFQAWMGRIFPTCSALASYCSSEANSAHLTLRTSKAPTWRSRSSCHPAMPDGSTSAVMWDLLS